MAQVRCQPSCFTYEQRICLPFSHTELSRSWKKMKIIYLNSVCMNHRKKERLLGKIIPLITTISVEDRTNSNQTESQDKPGLTSSQLSEVLKLFYNPKFLHQTVVRYWNSLSGAVVTAPSWSSRSIWTVLRQMVWFLGGLVWRKELDLMILKYPFQ